MSMGVDGVEWDQMCGALGIARVTEVQAGVSARTDTLTAKGRREYVPAEVWD